MSIEQSQQPARLYFGFDLAGVATPAVVAAVTDALDKPDFVCRYTEELAGVSTALTTTEVDALHQAGVAVGLVYNGALATDVSSLSIDDGIDNAAVAVAHLQALGVPPRTAVFVDVEAEYTLSSGFASGWIWGCHDGGYVGAFYLNAQSDEHVAAFLAARQNYPTLPTAIWSSEPELDAWFDTRLGTWYDFSATPLGAAHAGDVVLHQYSEEDLGSLVDLDLATESGYALLWRPAPPIQAPAIRWTALRAFGLLPSPFHGAPEVLTVNAGASGVDTGARRIDADGTVWANLGFGDAGQYYVGWAPASYIKEAS